MMELLHIFEETDFEKWLWYERERQTAEATTPGDSFEGPNREHVLSICTKEEPPVRFLANRVTLISVCHLNIYSNINR